MSRAAIEPARAAAEERARVLRAALDSVITDASADPADDEHDPDGSGGVAYERQQLVALLRAAEAEVAELDAAMIRAEDGTYGVCEVCGGPIGEARLEALPTARRCVRCAA